METSFEVHNLTEKLIKAFGNTNDPEKAFKILKTMRDDKEANVIVDAFAVQVKNGKTFLQIIKELASDQRDHELGLLAHLLYRRLADPNHPEPVADYLERVKPNIYHRTIQGNLDTLAIYRACRITVIAYFIVIGLSALLTLSAPNITLYGTHLKLLDTIILFGIDLALSFMLVGGCATLLAKAYSAKKRYHLHRLSYVEDVIMESLAVGFHNTDNPIEAMKIAKALQTEEDAALLISKIDQNVHKDGDIAKALLDTSQEIKNDGLALIAHLLDAGLEESNGKGHVTDILMAIGVYFHREVISRSFVRTGLAFGVIFNIIVGIFAVCFSLLIRVLFPDNPLFGYPLGISDLGITIATYVLFGLIITSISAYRWFTSQAPLYLKANQ